MSAQNDAIALLAAFADFSDDSVGSGYVPSENRPPKLATINPAYAGEATARVTFDGETVMSTKAYPAIGAVRAGGRALLLPVGRSYVILGTVGEPDNNPPGTYIWGAWASAPRGYLMVDGSVKLRADYPALFNVLGTNYNTGGETSLQFRLPPPGRSLVAVGTVTDDGGRTKAYTLHARGGEIAHIMTVAEMPSHSHAASVNGMSWPMPYSSADHAPSNWGSSSWPAITQASATIYAEGGGGAHNVLNPYIASSLAIRF